MPSVGSKTASQIILDLKGKLVEVNNNDSNKKSNPLVQQALDGLKSLGYKASELSSITSQLNSLQLNSVDEYLKEGLKLLVKLKGI